MRQSTTPENDRRVSAERVVFFSDAVVAIAITLLIIPLLESVSQAGAGNLTAGQWTVRNSGQILSLALSFVIIATFWIRHHVLYQGIALYIGPMVLASLLGWVSCHIIRERPDLWADGLKGPVREQEVLAITFALLYGLALLIPSVNYYFLFVMAFTPVGMRLVQQRIKPQNV